MQEIVTEFIAFVTSEACDKATEKSRTTITNDDVLEALKSLGFDHYHYQCKLLNDTLNRTKSKRDTEPILEANVDEDGQEVEEILGAEVEEKSADK